MVDEARVIGCLLGVALGDSLGLPYEGATPAQVEQLAGPELRQRFTPRGRGWASDDTDHTRLVAMALCTDPEAGPEFERALAWGLRWWIASLPVGIGLGTLRACVKLWLGFGPRRSGVYSAGNGPAMRAAILGAFNPDPTWLQRATRASTRVTHIDPRAESGALLVARLAALPHPDGVRAVLEGLHPELVESTTRVLDGLDAGAPLESLVDPAGVSGFVLHTVPAVVGVVVRHRDDFRGAIEQAVRLGGDTDTVAAIVGGIVGAWVGVDGLPRDWLDGYGDWPWSLDRLRDLGRAVASGGSPPSVPAIATFKSPPMLAFALVHLFRRWALMARGVG